MLGGLRNGFAGVTRGLTSPMSVTPAGPTGPAVTKMLRSEAGLDAHVAPGAHVA